MAAFFTVFATILIVREREGGREGARGGVGGEGRERERERDREYEYEIRKCSAEGKFSN